MSLSKQLKYPRFTIFTLFMLFLAGAYLRVITIQYSVVDNPIRADAAHYFNYATNLHKWGVFSRHNAPDTPPAPDALRSPGFPVFAYLFYNENTEVFEKNIQIAQTLLQIIVFTMLVLALLKYYGAASAIITSWFLWTFPHFVNINIYFLSESLFTSLLALLATVAIINNHSSQKKLLPSFIFGTILGLTIMVRPTLQYFPIFLFLVLWIHYRKINKASVIILLSALAPVFAWGIRNLIVLNQWSDPTLMINGLYHGSFPMFMYNNDPSTFGFPYRFDPAANEVYEGVGKTLDIIFNKAVLEPQTYISWYLVGKQFFLWQWDIIAGQGDIFIYPTLVSPYYGDELAQATHSIQKLIHLPWLLISFSGLFIYIKRVLYRQPIKQEAVIISSFMLYAVLIHIVVAPFPRYGIPFKIAAILVLAFSIKEVIEWIRTKFA